MRKVKAEKAFCWYYGKPAEAEMVEVVPGFSFPVCETCLLEGRLG